jgi:hypothetical protein
MRRKRREVQELRHLQVQESKIIFSSEAEPVNKCSICSKGDHILINPCECPTKYHERCLLLYIKGVIKRGLRVQEEMDLSRIRCRQCECQFHLVVTFRSEYSCQVLLRRMERNCCNKHLTAIAVLVIVIIVTVVILINQSDSSSNQKLIYALIALLVIEGLALLLVLSHFIQTYLQSKQIVLERVLEMIELRSMASSSSDENKVSDDCEVVVR